MAEHSVTFKCEASLEIMHKDITVNVKSDGEQLGTLTISKGGMGWIPYNGRYERVIEWEDFDEYMRNR